MRQRSRGRHPAGPGWMGAALVAALGLWPAVALADGSSCGELIDPHSGELRYRLEIAEEARGSSVERLTRYLQPDGTIVVETQTVFDRARGTWSSSRTVDRRSGRVLEARATDGRVEMLHRARTGAGEEKGSIPASPRALPPELIGELLSARFQGLDRGRPVELDLLVVEKQLAVGFRLVKVGAEQLDGGEAAVIAFEPSLFFLRAFAAPVRFYVRPGPEHRVLAAVGPAPFADADGRTRVVRTVWGTSCPASGEKENP